MNKNIILTYRRIQQQRLFWKSNSKWTRYMNKGLTRGEQQLIFFKTFFFVVH